MSELCFGYCMCSAKLRKDYTRALKKNYIKKSFQHALYPYFLVSLHRNGRFILIQQYENRCPTET